MAVFEKNRFYVTADAVVFTIHNNELRILLIKRNNEPFRNMYALPGGFVELDENLEDAAARELEEETGLKNIYLKKLNAYGDHDRDPRGRVITIPFLALIDAEKLNLRAAGDALLAKWQNVYELPELAFDHRKIIDHALEILRRDIKLTNIAFQIMPEKFTLTELQKAYETILDEKLDKRNFRKKLRELDILRPLRETKMEGAHRPAKLHSFREKKFRTF